MYVQCKHKGANQRKFIELKTIYEPILSSKACNINMYLYKFVQMVYITWDLIACIFCLKAYDFDMF